MDKIKIIESIHTLVANNVIGEKQLMSRYKGFKGELNYLDYHNSNFKKSRLLEGGVIVSIDSNDSSLDNALYVTSVPQSKFLEDIEDYKLIYSKLSGLGFVKLFLITYSEHSFDYLPVMNYDNEKIVLQVPNMNIYVFDPLVQNMVKKSNAITEITNYLTPIKSRGRNKYPIPDTCKTWLTENLKGFGREQLLQIYADRLLLDGFIGYAYKKGKMSDIDLIAKKGDEFKLIEIKEKDLPRKAKRGFGLDIPRIKDLEKISLKSNIQYFIIVRHVNNQEERKLLGWKFIDINSFIKDVINDKSVNGGTGMRSLNSKNPTLICSYELFSDL